MSSKQQDNHHENRRDKEKKKHFRDRSSKEKRSVKDESEKYAPATPIILGKSIKSTPLNQEPTQAILSSPSAKSFETHLETFSTTKLIDCVEFVQEAQKIFSDHNTDYSIIGIIGPAYDNQFKSKVVSVLQGNPFYSASQDDDATNFGITVSIVLIERIIILQYHEKSQPDFNSRENLLLGAFLFYVCDVILVGQIHDVDLTVCKFLKEIDSLKNRISQLSLQASSSIKLFPRLVFLFYNLRKDLQFKTEFLQHGNRIQETLQSNLFNLLRFPQLQPNNLHIFTLPAEDEDFNCEDPVNEFRDSVLDLCALTRQNRNYSALSSEREWFRNCSQIWESIKHSIV